MGVVQAFGKMYRSMVSNATRELVLNPRPIPVQAFDLNLAGAVIDFNKSEISFQHNPIPNTAHLTYSVKQVHPRSEVVRKQEALQMLQSGLTDPDGFKLFALKEGLDFAMWMDEDQSAYEQVVQNILTLFGNGTDPGQVVITPHTSRPELQLRVLSSFMSGPLMGQSDPLIVDEFKKYRESLIQFMGQSLPEMIPNPDSAALFAEQPPQPGPQPGPGMMQGMMNV
tara:strand:- start:18 stop:692 length:675 start_codon:yes stop_codon:yes gene_type:complete